MIAMRGKIRDLHLLNDSFEFKGRRYADSLVQHIFVGDNQKDNRAGVYAIRLAVTLNGGEKLVIQESDWGDGPFAALLLTDKTDELLGLRDAAEVLMRRTFDQRLAAYLSELKKNGYFTYGECKFYPFSKIVFKAKEFSLNEISLLRYENYVVLQPRNFSLLARLGRQFSLGKIPQFNTQTDTDVIFLLLKKYFGLTWR